jgi:zinc transport system substrate-binding protein
MFHPFVQILRFFLLALWVPVFVHVLAFSQAWASEKGEKEVVEYVVTLSPISALLKEILGPGAGKNVFTLLPPGASPHTHDLKPSDLRAASGAKALFYIGGGLDQWAVGVPVAKKYDLFGWVPDSVKQRAQGHHHHGSGGFDPHIWTSPMIFHAVIPDWVKALCETDSAQCEGFQERGKKLQEKLQAFSIEMEKELEPIREKAFLLSHHFLLYFLNQFGFERFEAVQDSHGKEPGPRGIQKIIRWTNQNEAKVVFVSQGLPLSSVRALQESTGIKQVELEPIATSPDKQDDYFKLIRWNVAQMVEALQ